MKKGVMVIVALFCMTISLSTTAYTLIKGKAHLEPLTMTTDKLTCPNEGHCATIYDHGHIYIPDYNYWGWVITALYNGENDGDFLGVDYIDIEPSE